MTTTTAAPPAFATPPELPERSHVYDAIAEKLGIDIDRLRADVADAIRTPLIVAEVPS